MGLKADTYKFHNIYSAPYIQKLMWHKLQKIKLHYL
ncbi:hypothetical protein PJE062_3643 [Pseudovibrio sp. JE062]|nr:hypothetical protein PJE062_3643 [Pseudovibrio sp. JE062]